MKANEKLTELRKLQSRVDSLREELKISSPGEVIFLAPLDEVEDDIVIIEADGFGGATTMVVEGNYPVDYLTKFERSFPSEEEAEAAAEDVAFNGISPRRRLVEPA